jgi:hypothetical protein
VIKRRSAICALFRPADTAVGTSSSRDDNGDAADSRKRVMLSREKPRQTWAPAA